MIQSVRDVVFSVCASSLSNSDVSDRVSVLVSARREIERALK
jgi:hypothetical protein